MRSGVITHTPTHTHILTHIPQKEAVVSSQSMRWWGFFVTANGRWNRLIRKSNGGLWRSRVEAEGSLASRSSGVIKAGMVAPAWRSVAGNESAPSVLRLRFLIFCRSWGADTETSDRRGPDKTKRLLWRRTRIPSTSERRQLPNVASDAFIVKGQRFGFISVTENTVQLSPVRGNIKISCVLDVLLLDLRSDQRREL